MIKRTETHFSQCKVKRVSSKSTLTLKVSNSNFIKLCTIIINELCVHTFTSDLNNCIFKILMNNIGRNISTCKTILFKKLNNVYLKSH